MSVAYADVPRTCEFMLHMCTCLAYVRVPRIRRYPGDPTPENSTFDLRSQLSAKSVTAII